MKKLNLSRYILVTSLSLTPLNKESIRKIFSPDLLSLNDIITADDLNNLLALHPHIEKNHYKLWLSSVSIMQKILHNAEHTRTESEIESILGKVKRYVQSDAYPRALNILDEEKFVIISGQPGVGKTTIAEMLLHAHIEKDFIPIVVNGNIEEARRLYSKDQKQIFYYDDFLGATFLGEQHSFLEANHDKDLLKFIEMVRRSKTARLILTTREHIFQQALRLSEQLSMGNILESKCVIEVSNYSRLQKAHMLYNHIYFSELPEKYIEILLSDKFYLHIIDHSKFNPRIIEWLSSYQRIKKIPPEDFSAFIMRLLADPGEIWLHAYNQQLSESARTMLLAVHSLGAHASVKDVFPVFEGLSGHRARKYNYSTKPGDKTLAMREVCDSFVTSKNGTITYINPSVADLMNRIIREIPENGVDIIYSAKTFSQLLQVWSIANADGGEGLREHIFGNFDTLLPTIRVLIESPLSEKRNNKNSSWDPQLHKRAICILEMAEFSKEEDLSSLLRVTFENTLKRLESGQISVQDGLVVYIEVLKSNFTRSVLTDEFIARFKATLIGALVVSPTSDELLSIVQYVEGADHWKNDIPTIKIALEDYLENNFFHELHACSDTYDLGELRDSVEFIADFLGHDLSQELQYFHEKGAELRETEEETSEEFNLFDSSQGSTKLEESNEVTSMFETLIVKKIKRNPLT